jgi:hypothetical protein
MTSPLWPTLTTRPLMSRILRCIGLLGGLAASNLGGRYRRRFHLGRLSPRDWPLPQRATLAALLQGCAIDLRTALCRMERRFDALPELWSYDVGPCFERDPSGNLRPNRCSGAYMIDIENFQKANPTATLFDGEVFHLGWEAGAKYGQDSSCTEDTGEMS